MGVPRTVAQVGDLWRQSDHDGLPGDGGDGTGAGTLTTHIFAVGTTLVLGLNLNYQLLVRQAIQGDY